MIIRIRETAADGDGFTATVSFDGEGEYPFRIVPPGTEADEKELAWYFERYLEMPFADQERARKAGELVRPYGEKLFSDVFGDRVAYAAFDTAKRSGLENIRFEIIGSPAFQKIHWEAIYDPNLPRPLAVDCVITRKARRLQANRAELQPSPVIRLLIVTARSGADNDVSYRTVQRPLLRKLRNGQIRVQADILRPGTYEALVRHLDAKGNGYYHVIHFDAHGTVGTGKQILANLEALRKMAEKAGMPQQVTFNLPFGRRPLLDTEPEQAFLFLSSPAIGMYDPVRATDLAALLTAKNVPIVILNACQSAQERGDDETTSLASRLMEAGVQTALAMSYSVTVTAAEIFMETLYQQLVSDGNIGQAVRKARYELYNRKQRTGYFNQKIPLEDWLLPVTYQNSEQRLAPRDFTPTEAQEWYARLAARYQEAETTFGFFGRDLDILRIENRLLSENGNILLVQGMGGAGKTTLLRHCAAWWQETQFIEQVFYYGYDEKAHTLQQILFALAQMLLTPVERAGLFDPSPLSVQQQVIVEQLRTKRHLLILDNLESITGAEMAIRNTLPESEQRALHGFLRALRGGQTLVLLGSRNVEAWLAQGTFDKGVHPLGGLDPEARSELAEAILKDIGKTEYRKLPDFVRLMRLLQGYPLAMQVILPNLATATPTEVIAALQAGNVDFLTNDGTDKTTSILKCIEYGASNLDAGLQSLLLCLMPFVGVFYTEYQAEYIERLQEQPELVGLPFERFGEMLATAERWGLVKRDDEIAIPGYLRLQPTLSFFLSHRLSGLEQQATRHAIQTAFHVHYNSFSKVIADLMESKDPQPKQIGQYLTNLEYENIYRALHIALDAKASIFQPYRALSYYLDVQQDIERGLRFAEEVRHRVTLNPSSVITDMARLELVSVIDDIAKWFLLLRVPNKTSWPD